MKTTAVIVTYNRKDDLLRCVKGVLAQSKKLTDIVIVNNASTDSTIEALCDFFDTDEDSKVSGKRFLLAQKDGTNIHLMNMPENSGGSGGFAEGLRIADKELCSDYFWLMDDDGYPTANCFEQLLARTEKFDYIMPVSIDINDHSKLSWATRKKNGKKTISYDELKESWGEIMDFVTPFNGVLLTKKCVQKVGYINKDFFIWGDDYEHYYRCRKNGFFPATLTEARFFHPAQKVILKKIVFGLFSVAYSESKLRMVCLARNWTYIYLHYNQKHKIPIKWLMYWWLFIITRRGDFEGWNLYKDSVRDGFRGDFTRHLQYLGK